MDQKKALMERIRQFVLDLDGTVYLGDSKQSNKDINIA